MPTIVVCWLELHISYSEGVKFQSATEMNLCPVISCCCHAIHVIQSHRKRWTGFDTAIT